MKLAKWLLNLIRTVAHGTNLQIRGKIILVFSGCMVKILTKI